MMRKKDQQPKGKEEKVHSLQNQFFHILLGPMGLGETLAFFFLRFGMRWEIQWMAQKKNKSKHNQGKESNKKQMMRKKQEKQPKGKEEKNKNKNTYKRKQKNKSKHTVYWKMYVSCILRCM